MSKRIVKGSDVILVAPNGDVSIATNTSIAKQLNTVRLNIAIKYKI